MTGHLPGKTGHYHGITGDHLQVKYPADDLLESASGQNRTKAPTFPAERRRIVARRSPTNKSPRTDPFRICSGRPPPPALTLLPAPPAELCATAHHRPPPPFAPRLSPSHPARPGLRAPPRDWWTPAKQTLPRLRARLRSVRARAFPNDVFPRSFRFFSRPVAGRRQPGGLLARAACRTTSGRTRTPPRILQSRCLRCTTTSRIS